jgi:malate permease and related proteins
MSNLILVILCLALGYLSKRVPSFPPRSHLTLNQFLIYFSLPALTLRFITELDFSLEFLFPIATSYLVFGFSWIFFTFLGNIFHWPRKLKACLILCAGFGNTSFVGFPVIEALYGAEGLKMAILVDQPGTFLAVSSIGVIAAASYASNGAHADIKGIMKKVLLFPPFLVFVIAISMNMLGLHFPDFILDTLGALGATVTPVALISVGMQLGGVGQSKHLKFLFIGLGYKLLIAPALILVLYFFVLKGSGLAVEVSIMEAAMGPMVTASIIAATYKHKPKLASMMVSIGIPISFLSLGLWYLLLQWIGI